MAGAINETKRYFVPCPFCGLGMVYVQVQIGNRTDQSVMAWACSCNQSEAASNSRVKRSIVDAQYVEPLKLK